MCRGRVWAGVAMELWGQARENADPLREALAQSSGLGKKLAPDLVHNCLAPSTSSEKLWVDPCTARVLT